MLLIFTSVCVYIDNGSCVVQSLQCSYSNDVLCPTVKHNPHSGNLRVLVKKCLELATNLRDESQCERSALYLKTDTCHCDATCMY